MIGPLARKVEDCLPIFTLLGTVGLLTLIAWQLQGALADSRRVHVMQERVVASLAAEAAAVRFTTEPTTDPEAPREFVHASGLSSVVTRELTDRGGELRIEVAGRRGRLHGFCCPLLEGAAPEFLGRPLSLGQEWLVSRPELRAWAERCGADIAPLDQFDLEAHLVVPSAETSLEGLVQEDPAIAVRRLIAGTDRADFVLTGKVVSRLALAGLVVVPGNLWVDRGDEPHVLALDRPLTLVVEGNIYLGRPLLVRGPGRLILVARNVGGPGFHDLDGDGRWSAGDQALAGKVDAYLGPVEGGGLIYLGLPGARDPRAAKVEVVGSLVAAAGIHVRGHRVIVHGAVVSGHGLWPVEAVSLQLTSSRLPDIHRAPIRGFRRHGAVRPGRLEPMAGAGQ